MTVTERTWKKYIADLRKINDRAADLMVQYLKTHRLETYDEIKAALDYAYALSTRYGEGAAELACEMYDAMAIASDVSLPAAVPAETATYGEVAKAFQGTMKTSLDPEVLGAVIGRMVKTAGVDTTMKNAIRDRAEWAWIPSGDTCAFCIALASRGWQTASANALKNGHGEHIHSNCDCTYAVRFRPDTRYEGYEPETYEEMYYDAPLDGQAATPENRINAMRREAYAKNKEKINAQKRDAYARRKELESSKAEEINVN